MREPLLRHQVVRLHHRVDVRQVDAERDAHEHVLRPLDDRAVHLEEVRALERLEAEEVIVEA